NNAIYRQGPNQYFFTVDAQTLDHLDVVRGSGSTLHGSDAIGGVILAVPLAALPNPSEREPGLVLKPRLTGRFASADLERGGRADVLVVHEGDTALRLG